MSRYELGEVVTGEVLPLRAKSGEPDTLGPEFADALDEVTENPYEVLPSEEWTSRYRDSTFAEALQTANPELIRKLAIDSLIAPGRARRRMARNAARRAGMRIE